MLMRGGTQVPVRMTVLGIPPPGKQKSPKKGAPPPLVSSARRAAQSAPFNAPMITTFT